MIDTISYFNKDLPEKFDGALSQQLTGIFQFEIKGAGEWHISPEAGVAAGKHSQPDCIVESDKETFDEILQDPSVAIGKFFDGKITASDLSMAMPLMTMLS